MAAAPRHLHRDTTSTSAIVAELDRVGYAIVEGMCSPDRVAAIKEELNRNNFEGRQTHRIYGLFGKTRLFDSLATDPMVLAVTARVLGTECFNLSAPTAILIGPGEVAQVPHRDDGKYPIARPHQELILNTMWAFDNFTRENGATVVYPGTHRNAPHAAPLDPDRKAALESFSESYNEAAEAASAVEPVQAVMPAGSAVFYRGSVLHGGGANRSNAPRMGAILEYCAGWLRPQENHCLVVPPKVVATLSERLQELLGYNVHPPFIGYVDGRHPKRLLEKAKL